MAQITTTLYVTIAEAMASARDQMVLASGYTTDATEAVVDITTGNYSPGAAAAIEVELALLGPCDSVDTAVTSLVNSTSAFLVAVRAINDFVIQEATGTAVIDQLTDFVNSCSWTLGCIPSSWAVLSADAGYDTSEWDVCS